MRSWFDPGRPDPALNEMHKGDGDLWERLLELSNPAVEVRTQLRLRSPLEETDRVADLCIDFREGVLSPVTVVVEIKHHDFAPHDDQLAAYSAAVESSRGVGNAAVVLLAPKDDIPRYQSELHAVVGQADEQPLPEVPPDVPVRAWESIPQVLKGIEDTTEVQSWVIQQFVRYLREERLMLPEALGPEQFVALARYEDALAGLIEVVGLARSRVSEARGEWQSVRPEVGVDTYANWELTPEAGWPAGAWLEFKVSSADLGIDGDAFNPFGEDIVFIAGVACKKSEDLFTEDDAQRRRENLLQEGFIEFEEDRCHRFMRVATPSSVLSGSSLSTQGEALALWIDSAFDLLAPKAHGDPKGNPGETTN